MKADFEKIIRRWRLNYVGPLERWFGEAWTWWVGELAAMLPEALRASLATSRQQTFLQLSGSEIVAFHGSIERMQEIGRVTPGGASEALRVPAEAGSVILLLPPQRMLRKMITLPAATEENLREVLAFEMDQQTPFTPDQVYYDFVISGRSAAAKTVEVELVVAPRKQLDELLDSLRALDLAPDVVTARRDASSMYAINLLPSDGRASRPAVVDRLNTGLAIAALLLLAAAVALPVIQKRLAIAELEPRVASAAEAAREGSRLRENVEKIVAGSQILVRKKESAPMVIRIIDEMSRVVPDGTWISQINIEGGEVQLQGQSPAAASLIGLLEASSSFADPQFRSPVTQVPRSNLERFHLSAEWSPPGASAP
ncbi:MAG: PilN domain-containing protein [Gammaproteobacteria bacterium]|nr:PilN domain-containing protein [Gammaproteobacteria bacterium]MDH4253162.1 PilN domain-containing protein [Gammaproteobacteria bacterium]MDH5308476.1 PilN domain-containing protein [Gammaproteobacteria bacterium]